MKSGHLNFINYYLYYINVYIYNIYIYIYIYNIIYTCMHKGKYVHKNMIIVSADIS